MAKGFARFLKGEGLGDLDKLRGLGVLRGEAGAQRLLLGVVSIEQLERIVAKVFDETEFLSPYGLRALSAFHRDQPYDLDAQGIRASIDYEPAESTTNMFGGNSNWRGPVWFPLNYMVIEALERYDRFFGEDLTVEYPTGSGNRITLGEVAQDLRRRLVSLFLVGDDGRRPCFGYVGPFQTGPLWKDNLLFNEYFHGDNGAGLGASHQTGWTGLVADLIRRRYGAVPELGDVLRQNLALAVGRLRFPPAQLLCAAAPHDLLHLLDRGARHHRGLIGALQSVAHRVRGLVGRDNNDRPRPALQGLAEVLDLPMVERSSKAGDQRAAARTDDGGADDRGREQDAYNRADNGALTPTVMRLAVQYQRFAIAVLDERRVGDIYIARLRRRLEGRPVRLGGFEGRPVDVRSGVLAVNGDNRVQVGHGWLLSDPARCCYLGGPPRSQAGPSEDDGLAFAPGLDLILALHANALAFACWNSASLITPLSRRSASWAISSAALVPFVLTALWTYWRKAVSWAWAS